MDMSQVVVFSIGDTEHHLMWKGARVVLAGVKSEHNLHETSLASK